MHDWKFIIIVVLLVTIGISATDIYIPSFPAIEDSLGTNSSLVQSTIAVYLFLFAFSQMIFGPYSDIIGRYKIIKYGLLLSLLATIICMISPNIEIFIFGRFFTSYGYG